MGSGLGWTSEWKRCRCLKCNKPQKKMWFDLFNGTARCVSCGEKMEIGCQLYLIKERLGEEAYRKLLEGAE